MYPVSAPEWQRAFLASLEANAADSASRFAHLATVDERGLPSVRTVTWRGFDERGRLRIATDRRSGKVRHLASRPAAELCAYFASTREQYRIGCLVAMVTSDGPAGEVKARAELWAALSPATRAMFVGPRGAGASPVADADDAPPSTFVLLLLEPLRVDHLDTRPRPHARRLHELTPGGEWKSSRIPP